MERKNKLKNWLAENKILILILSLSFALSLVYSFHFKITPAVDARAYDAIAMNLVEGRGYREDLGVDIQHDIAIVRVGPLYEFFLAGVYKIFGHHYGPVWVIQALLHALSAWLVYLVCILIFRGQEHSKKIGLWSAAIIGLYPDLIEISAMLMIETLYVFLVCLMLYVFFKNFNQINVRSVILLALIFGLTILARPPVLFLIPIIIFYFCRKRKLLFSVLFFSILFLVFVPWTARNYQVYGKSMPLGVAGSYNFWIGNHVGATGEQEQPQEAFDFIASHKIRDLSNESLKQAKNFVINHPVEFIKLTFLRTNKYFSVIRPMGFWFYQSGIGQLLFLLSSGLASIILFIFSLGGFIKVIKLKHELLNYLAAFTIATPLILFITVVETRYRFQIYPFLAIFSGYFIILLIKTHKWWLNKTLWFSSLIVFLNSAVDLLLSLEKIKEKLGLFFH